VNAHAQSDRDAGRLSPYGAVAENPNGFLRGIVKGGEVAAVPFFFGLLGQESRELMGRCEVGGYDPFGNLGSVNAVGGAELDGRRQE